MINVIWVGLHFVKTDIVLARQNLLNGLYVFVWTSIAEIDILNVRIIVKRY